MLLIDYNTVLPGGSNSMANGWYVSGILTPTRSSNPGLMGHAVIVFTIYMVLQESLTRFYPIELIF